MAVTAYSSFGPQSFLELEMQRAKDTPLLFDNPTVKTIADKHNKTPAQVLLRWATQRNIAVIPKSNNQSRLQQNLDVTSFDLSKSELDEISGLNKHLRFNDPLNVSDTFPRPRPIAPLTSDAVWRESAYLCVESYPDQSAKFSISGLWNMYHYIEMDAEV